MDGTQVAMLAAGGVVAGLALLVRGMLGHGTAARIADTATSRVSSLAIGEVRVSGVAEAAGATLVSPLQSIDCLYYRAAIDELEGDAGGTLLDDERAVGFRVRDETGAVRVFPRGAAWDVPWTWEDSIDAFGEPPPGLRLRTGSAFGGGGLVDGGWSFGPGLGGLSGGGLTDGGRRRRYAEARIEPGQVVTVVGHVLPFEELSDPFGADLGGAANAAAPLADPEIAADLAAAREAGILAATPEEAWGNAAIPGFGIGMPARAPELEAGVRTLPLAPPGEVERARATFHIGARDLVIAAGPEHPLIVAAGPPGTAVARHEQRFLIGLLGAVLAIASAVVLAIALSGFTVGSVGS